MDKKYSRSDVTNIVYEKMTSSSLTIKKSEVDECLSCLYDFLIDALSCADTVEIRGFGTFETKIRAAKNNARNLFTGERVEAKAHRIAVFKPGVSLKQRMSVPLDENKRS